MSNFDELKKTAKETMETIADRSVELYKIAEEKTRIIAKRTRLSAEIAVEKGGVRNLYKEIGKTYYELNKNDPQPPFKQLCAEVDAAMEVIDAKQKELDALKNAGYVNVDFTPAEEEAEPEPAAAEPSEPAAGEAPPYGTYTAPAPDAYTAAPEADKAPPENDWQKRYPPEFKL